jgi:hypothetical protein
MRVRVHLLSALMLACQLSAHDVITTKLTYSRDISRIFAQRCISCHGPASSVPLTSYEAVRPWAVDIKGQVLSRAMPPWGAVKGFGDLSPDGALTQEEILIIAAWAVGGAPQGDPSLLPKSEPAHSPPSVGLLLQDAALVQTRSQLSKQLRVAAVRPLPETDIKSAKVTARFPDGRIQPLVWLYDFDAHWNRTFRFREPLQLPAGTVIESSAPLRFALEVVGPQPLATSIKP